MSLFDRRTLILLPLALAACGFEPVYGTGGTGSALHNRIQVDAPADRDSYLLVQALEQRFGQPMQAQYRLKPTLSLVTEGQAVTTTNDITRYSLVGRVEYELIRTQDDTVVASGDVKNFTGYSATGSTVETLAAERDAHQRLMIILADQLVVRIQSTADLQA